MASEVKDFEHIKNLELELVRPETRKNIIRLDQLICDEFEEFGSSGKVYDKNCILKLLSESEPVLYQLYDFRFKVLSEGCILVKYISKCKGISANRSSIWIKACERWKILHHQSTIIPGSI